MIPFDIETKPRPDLVRRFIPPFGAFDPSAVKYGNTKDPAKRAELLSQKQSDHLTEEAAYWAKAEERASLNPVTAEILCIGLLVQGKLLVLAGEERDILAEFWSIFSAAGNASERFVFWSGNGSSTENFDPDMIIRRSWILGMPVSPLAFNGRYLASRFEDATARYLLGKRDAYCGLSRAADELGLFVAGVPIFPKADTDPVQGVNFWQWWCGCADKLIAEQGRPALTGMQQREWATKYLRNDLLILQAIAERLF